MNVMIPPKVALIAGPTASGKSAIAVALARALRDAGRDAVVVNADASQVYAGIPILSAQPDAAEMADIPHALFGHIDAAEACDAARWAADARRVVDDAAARGAIPILVGGTGLYIRTLIDGIAPVPPIDPDVRTAVRAMPPVEAHDRLRALDPAAAARLPAADSARVSRALEVALSTGRTLADWQAERQGGIGERIALFPAILLPPRNWLRARCDARFDAMLAAGAVEEVRALLARGLSPSLPAMRAIGVPQIAEHLHGGVSLDQAAQAATAATRQYAKRQYTWFRHQPPPHWRRHDQVADARSIVILLRNELLTG